MTSDTINDTVLQRHGVTREEYDRIIGFLGASRISPSSGSFR